MLSVSRLALNPVQRARIPFLSTSLLSGIRTYADEAGPSRDESYRNKQRRHVRESVASGRTTEIKDLSFLDAASSPRRSSKPSQSRSGSGYGLGGGSRSEGSFSSPRFGSRRDRDTHYTDKRLREKAVKKGDAEPQSPYTSSERVKAWISRHDSPLSEKQVEEVIKMVEDMHPRSVNAAVWNLVLGLLGREKKYQRMWKVFNHMKKRGVFPSSYTYTTLLNAYAGVSHANIQAGQFTPQTRPEKLTLDRVRSIYDQSQRHIMDMLRKEQGEGPDAEAETGLAAIPKWPGTENPTSISVGRAEVSVTPTNSYLKFLSRFGMWDEIQRVFVSMDASGPLAPDTVTYQILFQTIYSIQLYRVSNPDSPLVAGEWADFDIGSITRGYFDQAVRQLCPRTAPAEFDPRRKLDEPLTQIALLCLAISRPADQRLVEKLVPHLWNLPSPSQPSVASTSVGGPADVLPGAPADLPLLYSNLPKFKLSVRSATQLMVMLSRIDNRAAALHYGHFIMERQELRSEWDFPALRAAVYLFSNGRDVDGVQGILESYQPNTGKDGWPVDVWHGALRAARWGADWKAALNFFRRMTHLPFGVENGDAPKPYVFYPPNGRPADIRRKTWVPAAPHRADAASMALLLKAGVAAGLKELRQAVNVFAHYGSSHWWILERSGAIIDLRAPPVDELSSALRRAVADRVELAKDIMDATERLTLMPKDRQELFALKDEAREVIRHYEALSRRKAAAPERPRKATPKPREARAVEEVEEGEEREEREERPRRTEQDRSRRFEGQQRRDGDRRRDDRPREDRARRYDNRDGQDRPREDRPRRFDNRDGQDRPRRFDGDRPRRNEGRPRYGLQRDNREDRPRRYEGSDRGSRSERDE